MPLLLIIIIIIIIITIKYLLRIHLDICVSLKYLLRIDFWSKGKIFRMPIYVLSCGMITDFMIFLPLPQTKRFSIF